MEKKARTDPTGNAAASGGSATFDTVVIGGGISGAAAARELARSGVSVLLLEANDFASGTTSRTSRLQYCGLAYLADFTRFRDIVRHPFKLLTALRLARRSMSDRRRFLSSHPHLLKAIPFQIPIFSDEGPSPAKMGLAMMVMTALSPGSPLSWRLLSAQAAKTLPFMRDIPKPLAGAVTYLDYQYDWPERVCLEAITQAKTLGALARNHASVTALEQSGKEWLVTYNDRRTHQSVTVRAASVVNCAGPWVDDLTSSAGLEVAKLNAGEKGANMMVRLPDQYRGHGLQVRTAKDGTFYIIPWNDLHYIGPVNTDSEVGDANSFRVTDADIERLLTIATRYLSPEAAEGLEPLFAWAGTRPRTRDRYSGRPQATPRLHRPHETGLPGYFVYTGGLLMMQESIGRECARAVCRWLGRSWRRNQSKSPLVPAPSRPSALTRENVRRMVHEEQALTLEDILFRRTARGWDADMGVSDLPNVAQWLGETLGWSATDRETAIAEYLEIIADQYRGPVGGGSQAAAQC